MTALDEEARAEDAWLDRLIDGRYRVQQWLSGDETHVLVRCSEIRVGRAVLVKVLAAGLWATRPSSPPFEQIASRPAEVRHRRLAVIPGKPRES